MDATHILPNIRAHFPALFSGFAFLENAGGSQLPALVIDAMAAYMRESYVQLGASYDRSVTATQVVSRAHEVMDTFVGAGATGRCILGPSTSQLCAMLAECYSRILRAGDEVIICETAHESNAGPWERLGRFGVVAKTWRVNPSDFSCSVDELGDLLSRNTRIVAFPHVSNLLGEIVDVEAITRLVHERSPARVVCDGVAYASHRLIDVEAWGMDFYVMSNYKVFGPHMSTMFGRTEAWTELTGPNHFFIPDRQFPSKFELGGACHEGCAGIVALGEYLLALAKLNGSAEQAFSRAVVEAAFHLVERFELPLQQRLINYLVGAPGVRVIGPPHGERSRVSTISFVHESISPKQIVARVHESPIGIRYGNAYAYRLCQTLGLDPESGVVRASMVHYNSFEEIERLITVLQALFR